MGNTRVLTQLARVEEIPLHMFLTDEYSRDVQMRNLLHLDGRTFTAGSTKTLEARIPAWFAQYLKTKHVWPTTMHPIRFTLLATTGEPVRLRVETMDTELRPENSGE